MIRPADAGDHGAIWSIIEPAIRAGETLALPRDMTREAALALWFASDRSTHVWDENGQVLGVFYIRPNQQGGGAHVANGGYVVAQAARGRGIARAMCVASIDLARAAEYRAMQFNFVVSTNDRAVRLWEAMGFAVVGRLPDAFLHPRGDYVDALVMARPL